jgi:hypothetical protein
MNYGDATDLTLKLQTKTGDNKNILVKSAIANQFEDTTDHVFSICVRRVTFAPPLLLMLIEFATDHGKQLIIRNADVEANPEEKFIPASGEWKYENLICVIY